MTRKRNSSFWKGRVVFLTGISGFVGSSLAQSLIERGAEVLGLVPPEKRRSYFYDQGLQRKASIFSGNLEDPRLLLKIMGSHPIEIVYHLAAQAIVGKANQDPVPTLRTNIEGTWNLLEACRLKGKKVKAIVMASSDKAYGSHKKLPYRENFALQPEFPYDVSKACADMIARSYYRTFELPVVVTRFANIYGPGDYNFSRIVPDTVRSILKGQRPVIRSDGKPERDYLYVGDVVDLYLLLAERIEKTRGEIFNAGHNKPVSVLKVVQTLLRLAGRSDLKPDILGKGNLHGEIDRQWLDGAKAARVLKWKPKVSLEDGLRKTLTWYESVLVQ